MTHISEESLVDYLYDEGDPAERLKVARHLQDCAACSVTVLEMQSVRGLLSEWKPPPVQLGFKIVSADEDVPAAPRWWRVGAGWPAWAKAAAGVLVFAAGMAVSQLSVEYGGGALTVRVRPAGSVATASTVGDIMLPPMAVMPVSESGNPSNPPLDLTGLESRLKTMIDQSEGRQQRALALRLTELVQDVETQRRADMLNVEQNFGQLEGQTGAEVAQQRELLNSLVKVSQQAK
jgi:anti-sigma factor RsiW